jgi:hypothetical protein
MRKNKVDPNTLELLPFHTIYQKCEKCSKKGYTQIRRSLKRSIKIRMVVLYLACLPCFARYLDKDKSYKSLHFCVFCSHYIGETGDKIKVI